MKHKIFNMKQIVSVLQQVLTKDNSPYTEITNDFKIYIL